MNELGSTPSSDRYDRFLRKRAAGAGAGSARRTRSDCVIATKPSTPPIAICFGARGCST